MKRNYKKITIAFIAIDILAIICFFVVYGPWHYPKNFWITTSMTSLSHHYLARIFYSDTTIKKTLSENYIIEIDEDTNINDITINQIEEQKEYTSIYEKTILEREKDASYKMIEFKYNGYNCYLTAIYDPLRVSLAVSSKLGYLGETITTMAKRNKAIVAINGGGFIDPSGKGNGGIPKGSVIQNGKLIYSNGNYKEKLAGFNDKGVLILANKTAKEAIKDGMKYAVTFGPFLIVNGKKAVTEGNGGWGINPRTVLAQRKDGIVLFLVVDGNGSSDWRTWNGRGGASMDDLITILERYSAYNAVNMDGGASTGLTINGKLYNNPCSGSSVNGERLIPNIWMMR